ncbi:hypothetical protein BDN70DRAFT_308805 [Pholiota conissans]|uniref:CENP-V/GFA domain-containing protein n=1 Tax=Pholiota conissans TaxID=109636 RepID=A0A9P5YS98_9AGAR|nr:hypothetical protein BDN70DRAFT_308805 [Pholiota conissans]
MTTYVNASCQCELNAFRVTFDTTFLPISNEICHCSTCRHSSGQMALCHVAIEGVPLNRANGLSVHSSRSSSRSGFRNIDDIERSSSRPRKETGIHHHPSPTLALNAGCIARPILEVGEEHEMPYDLGDMTAYKTSPDVTRYFCTSCSAQLFWVHHMDDGDVWKVAVGVLDRTEGVVKRGIHIWVGDTLDGGVADQLRVIGGIKMPRYREIAGGEELVLGWRADCFTRTYESSAEPTSSGGQLKAFCHCRTISFVVSRPSEVSLFPSAAYPDLLYPYGVSRMSEIVNSNDEKWWLRPKLSLHPTKYLAGHCMCRFCRQCSGFEIQSWAFIPLANILAPGSTNSLCLEVDEKRPAGLKQFISSPGEYKEFCGTCGATVFSWKAGTPDLINISVGLLDEENSGARAEDWLEWHRERVSHQEKALSPSLAKALQEGIKHFWNQIDSTFLVDPTDALT